MEVTLKEAAVLCKKSEKTLRRKIEAGLLGGRREPLEFGGFMWMINIESLEELYPGCRPSTLPQVYDAPEPPQVRLKNRPESSGEFHSLVSQQEARMTEFEDEQDEDEDDDEEADEWNIRRSFLDYIIDENRSLKTELRDRDARIHALNERAFVLERALGEQEGTSTTQARVLEWFQTQESSREKKRQEAEEKLLTAGPQGEPDKKPSPWTAALGGAGVVLLLVLLLLATGALGPAV